MIKIKNYKKRKREVEYRQVWGGGGELVVGVFCL